MFADVDGEANPSFAGDDDRSVFARH
jgi:hypothetical protein